MSELISISNLSKSYGKQTVLRELSFNVEKGQILGLVGPNGAGKTTCLQAVLGLTDSEGKVNVLGFDPHKQRQKMLEKVAYIADVAVLPKWIKVSELLFYMSEVHPNFSQTKAEAFLAKTNISSNSKVQALSKGMVTQLHLALILAVDAQVLILDEPTLGLDLLTRRQFYTHLLEEFYSEDKCIIVATHQVEEIEHILTDVAFIKNGEMVLIDSVDAIRKRFQMIAVNNDLLEQANEFKPLSRNSLMGVTNMLFDCEMNVTNEQLANLGSVNFASLADIFVGLMNKELVK